MQMTWAVRAGISIFIAIIMNSPATAAKRVALVIGNAAYQHAPPLANPGNDAEDLALTLGGLGFDVTQKRDLKKSEMDRVLSGFATSLKGAEIGLFFYAGHGLQVAGQNYLVPVDATLDSASALEFEAVRLDLVQRIMENETPTNVLILDACRDNPLSRNLARSMGTRSSAIGKGLAAQESGAGTLISYSTQPGNVALDGTGRNSPFASALLKHLPSGGRGLTSALIAVRNEVMAATAKRQVPWEHSALTSELVLAKSSGAVAADPPEVASVPAQKDTGKAEQQRDTGANTALAATVPQANPVPTAVPQPAVAPATPAPQNASPSDPGIIFEDHFDGDALGPRWTLLNEDKAGYLVEGGSMVLLTSKKFEETAPPILLSSQNAMHLPDLALIGDWDITAVVRPDFSRVTGALFQIGLKDGDAIPLRASLVFSSCFQGHQLRLEMLATGAQAAQVGAEIWSSCQYIGSTTGMSGKDFASRIADIRKDGLTFALHKRGRDYYATVISPVPGGKARTDAITLLRAKGTAALAIRHNSDIGQTSVLLDDFSIRKAQ